MQTERKVVELNIADVLPNRFQPRIKFDENSINELALSIRKYGVIQPIVVRKIGDKYEIIAGERRYKASVIAGKQTIPAIISEMNDKESVEIALIENVQREDLTPIEKAISYKKILDMGYISQEELAKKVGKSQSSIANTLRLLNLSDDVQEALLENRISERHARSLLKVKDETKQVEMLNRIINERLTVRKTDEEIDKMLNENLNNNTFAQDEVVQIPDVAQVPDIELSDIDTTQLPGFMDIDKIEQTAKDITPQEKPIANMDELLKPTAAELTPEIETQESKEPQGKFFNFFDEESTKENSQASDFNLENFFSNMDDKGVEQPLSSSTSEVPSVSAEPIMPEEPQTPEVPSIPTEPIMPEVPQAPEIPSISAEPIMPEVPQAPEIPSISAEPIMPEVPQTQEIPSTPVEPIMPEVPQTQEIPSTPVEPIMPEIPQTPEIPSVSAEPIMPEVPQAPEIPSISAEPIMPEIPQTQETPSTPVEPVMPEIPQTQETPSTPVEPVMPEIPTAPIDTTPLYEVPIAEDTENVPTIDGNNNVEQPVNNIAEQSNEPTISAIAPNLRLALNTIRECEGTLEKYGFNVDVEEIDFEDSYQVIFKIEKK